MSLWNASAGKPISRWIIQEIILILRCNRREKIVSTMLEQNLKLAQANFTDKRPNAVDDFGRSRLIPDLLSVEIIYHREVRRLILLTFSRE